MHFLCEFRDSDKTQFIFVAVFADWRRCQMQIHQRVTGPIFDPEIRIANRVLPELVRHVNRPHYGIRCPSEQPGKGRCTHAVIRR